MSPTRRPLVLLAALLLLGTALAPATTLAQDDGPDDDEREDEIEHEDDEQEREREDERETEHEDERAVNVETEGKDVKIELEQETSPQESEVKMTWEAEDATFKLEHESENETREIEHELEATFWGLAEYHDENDNGAYDPGEEIVDGFALGEDADDEELALDQDATWQQPTTQDITRDGHDGKQITSTAHLADEGTFTLRLLVFGEFVQLDDTQLTPTSAKIDIVIEDYPYQANQTDLTLFLETKTESELEVDLDDETETGVTAAHPINETEPRLAFTWKDTAQIEGTTHSVATTLLEEEREMERDAEESSSEHERAFALSYPRGDEIVHDPKAEILTGSNVHASVPHPALAGLLATLAAVAIVPRRAR